MGQMSYDIQKAIKGNMVHRVTLLQECERDPRFAAMVIDRCREDAKFFINNMIWTYDPRNNAKGLPALNPMVLYEAQDELIDFIEDLRADQIDGNIPKARGTGATWTCSAWSVWAWLFEEGISIGWGSRKELLVDRINDPDCIFEKFRICLRNLPGWFLRAVVPDFSWDKHDNFMRLINPNNGATITGEAGSNIGRGGRKSIYFIDEFAHVDRKQEVERAVLQTTDVVVRISTPAGQDEFEEAVKKDGARNHYMSWDTVPWRDKAWYEKQRARYGGDTAGFAQEVDMDFYSSVENVCIPAKWVEAAVNYLEPSDLKGVHDVYSGLDVALDGDISVLTHRVGPVVLPQSSWSGLDTTKASWRVIEECNEQGTYFLGFDAIGLGAGIDGALKNATCTKCGGKGCDFCDDGVGYPGFNFMGVRVSDPATENWWPNDKQSKDFIYNLRSELWWTIRDRFRKTYENVECGAAYPIDECISIPNSEILKKELSAPRFLDQTKYRVESKKQIKKRLSNRSTDHADSMLLAFAPEIIGIYDEIWF